MPAEERVERDRRLRRAVLAGDEHAWRADVEPASARWSFTRDFGDADHGVRLLAVDSRCSRDLRTDHRRILDDVEWAWVREAAVAFAAKGTPLVEERAERTSRNQGAHQ